MQVAQEGPCGLRRELRIAGAQAEEKAVARGAGIPPPVPPAWRREAAPRSRTRPAARRASRALLLADELAHLENRDRRQQAHEEQEQQHKERERAAENDPVPPRRDEIAPRRG